MTGFGKAEFSDDNISVQVELKSLNSKFLDANLKLPKNYTDKEIEIRNLLSKRIKRGKVLCSLSIDYLNPVKLKRELNFELLKKYHEDFQHLSDELKIPSADLFTALVNLPDAFKPLDQDEDEEEWKQVSATLNRACDALVDFRQKEGKALMQEIKNDLEVIKEMAGAINKEKDERIDEKRKSLLEKLQELKDEQSFDEQRLHQELIYYIEKLDINEELTRLRTHIEHFISVMQEEESGKKLNFLSQEIGREINTIGSKAQSSGIQHKVVNMKDRLERIKEQVLNIL